MVKRVDDVEKLEKLKQILIELYNENDSVPAASSTRTTGLDWFSEGVKNNVVAYIALKIFGEEAKKFLNDEEIYDYYPESNETVGVKK